MEHSKIKKLNIILGVLEKGREDAFVTSSEKHSLLGADSQEAHLLSKNFEEICDAIDEEIARIKNKINKIVGENTDKMEATSNASFAQIKKSLILSIDNFNRFVSAKELFHDIKKQYNSITMISVSAVLSYLRKHNELVCIGNSNKHKYWGKKEWLDEKGEMKNEFINVDQQWGITL